MMSIRPPLTRCLSGLALFALAAVTQAAEPGVTYKCPGHVYSNTISAKEAKDKGCTVLDNAPISVCLLYTSPSPRDS